jgi:hypothetical protein
LLPAILSREMAAAISHAVPLSPSKCACLFVPSVLFVNDKLVNVVAGRDTVIV